MTPNSKPSKLASSRKCFLFCTAIFFCLTSFFILTSCTHSPEPLTQEVAAPKYSKVGEQLTKGVAACGQCHGALGSDSRPAPHLPLTGGQTLVDEYGEVVAPNLTAPYLKEWSNGRVARAIRRSERPDGSQFAAVHHLGYQWMSDFDAYQIASYIRSLPHRGQVHERRQLSKLSRYTKGLTEKRVAVAGYVPPINEKEGTSFGKYLTENVARCSACHNREATIFSKEAYLQGGKEISRGELTKLAPGITNSDTFGIGEWSEAQLLRFLRTGKAPGGAFRQSEICPTEFYATATSAQLRSIASYIKTVRNEDS